METYCRLISCRDLSKWLEFLIGKQGVWAAYSTNWSEELDEYVEVPDLCDSCVLVGVG